MNTSSQNWYPLVLIQLHFINTTLLGSFIWDIYWKSLKNRNMLYFKSKIIQIGDNHIEAAEFTGLSCLKQCIGHMCTWKTLPSFAHPDGTDMWKLGSWPMDYINVLCYLERLQHLKPDMLVKQVYLDLLRLHNCGHNTWVTSVFELAQGYNLAIGIDDYDRFKKSCRLVLTNCFKINWLLEVRNDEKTSHYKDI